jgi:5'-nucleotidase
MNILLTNDDGYQSEGISVLETVLAEAGHEVWVCAPSDQRSAQSHAMTLKGKIKFIRYDARHYHCSGTPADCILYGLNGEAIPIVPDVIISGINHGYNASTDILYSGTVGAASEAALRGVPAMAVSARADKETGVYPFVEAAAFVAEHLHEFLPLCTRDVLLNINVPPQPNGKWRVGMIGQLAYFDVVERSSSARSTSYDASSTKLGLAFGDADVDANGVGIGDEMTLLLKTEVPPELIHSELETDYHILGEHYISVTPITVHPVVDMHTAEVLEKLRQGSSDV